MRCSSFVLGLLSTVAMCGVGLGACSSGGGGAGGGGGGAAAGGGGAGGSGPPPWLGDAGLAQRAPVARPLHALCGLASNPGDMPPGQDPASKHLREGYFDAALDLGGVMIRRDFLFDEIEPQKGTFSFDSYDLLVDEAGARGVRLLGTLAYGTLWSNPAAKDVYWPPDPDDFAGYAAATAGRYQGKLVGWEIWNEPNGGFRFWKPTLSGDPAAYGELLTRASTAIHTADPSARVLLGGTVFTPQIIEGAMQWLGEAYAAHPDLAKSFDVAGIHTYMTYPPRVPPEASDDNDAPLEAKIQMHAHLLDQHGGGDKEMWITEIGWPVTSDVSEAQQASYLVRATILAARAGAGGVFWYTLRDGPHPESWPPEDAFGLLRYDPDPGAQSPAEPKPAYVALKALLAVVGERWPDAPAMDAAQAAASAGTWVVTFEGDDPGPVFAAWQVSGKGSFVAPIDGALMAQDGSPKGSVKKGEAIATSEEVVYLK